jgi:EAL and modified HD-GYP domain-containing signal transduction protein
MASQSVLSNANQTATPNWAGEMRYVSRQPILDLRGHVHGYELLFRDTPEAVLGAKAAMSQESVLSQKAALAHGADQAARTMLDNAVIFGLEWLTNGLPAFVNCTVESLTEDLVLVLAPESTVLIVPANVALTERVVEACVRLRSRGFRLALDDFPWKPELRPLAEMVEYIRVDFDKFGSNERKYLRELGCAVIAKKVETQEDYQKAYAEGIKLFQGGYFCHPVLLKKRKVPANRLLHFEIVRLLHHDPMDVNEVSKLVQRDASLTMRLLRLVNSPLYGIQQEVRSVKAAIIVAGENAFRRIVSLAVLSEMNGDEPPEILHMSLVRARFCEIAARLCDLEPSEQYLLGMLSLVPAMLRLPMEELTPSLPLRAEICEALQGTENPERSMLSWLEGHERGDWETCDSIAQANRLNPEQLMRCYADAMGWAEQALHTSV